jgi:hypothetical protein
MHRKVLIGLITITVAVIGAYLAASSTGSVAAQGTTCVTCHQDVTPGIVTQFLASKKAAAGLDCATCHGSGHTAMDDAELAQMPTPDTCKICHPEQYEQYAAGKHSLAWAVMEAMPMLRHQPQAVGGTEMKGCSGCHKIGLKSEAYTATEGFHYGTGACDSCHTRHSFSAAEARDPRACMTCHMGFDHPQWEMWSSSKHGVIWQIEEGSGRAPTCQTCHMPGGDHEVRTAWAFWHSAARTISMDGGRAVILQALGVLDGAGAPTARLEAVKAADLARLTAESFAAERDGMKQICSECHALRFAESHLNASDNVIREADALMAEAILTVKALYDDGILAKPAGWEFAPDILQFYEAPTSIEQELWVMFLEYRMRAFQGAFHMNPDYMHWYGWAEMKNSLARIKTEAAALRGE